VAADFTPAARVIADSISPAGHRLTTLEVAIHRFVLAELNTHRAFSRNSASSRAIPVTITMANIADAPAVPLRWPHEARGMQGGPELDPPLANQARDIWLAARDDAMNRAEQLLALGVHKSVTNRLLEPFLPHSVLISATDWDAFFEQRCSPLAQAEIEVPARMMRAALRRSDPTDLPYGQWHLPYITTEEQSGHSLDTLRQVSTARCARTSYLADTQARNLHGRRNIEQELGLYERLVTAHPAHASPLEHVATPIDPAGPTPPGSNFTGWYQLRHLVLGPFEQVEAL
jgi:hypothetical protein